MILRRLLHEETAVLAGNGVVDNPRIIQLFKNHSMPAIGENDVAFDDGVSAEHQGSAHCVVRHGICEQPVLVRIHIMDAKSGVPNSIAGD